MGVTPLVDLMWDRVLLGQIIAMDETPGRELGGHGKTLTGYLRTGVGDAKHPYDCICYTSDRRTIRPREFLSRYHGYLLTAATPGPTRLSPAFPPGESSRLGCHAHRHHAVTLPFEVTVICRGPGPRAVFFSPPARIRSSA